MIAGIKDVAVMIENREIKTNPVTLTTESFSDYRDYLEDPKRKLPIIAIASDRKGKYPINPKQLALDLQSLCHIYLFDLSNKELETMLSQWNADHDDYRLDESLLRIYQPEINYSDADDSKRHRWFCDRNIQGSNYRGWRDDIMSGFVRNNAKALESSKQVTSIADINQKIKDARRDELAKELAHRKTKEERESARREAAKQLDRLLDKFISSQSAPAKDDKRLNDLKENYDLLLLEKDEEIDRLREMLSLVQNDLSEAMTIAEETEKQYQTAKQENLALQSISYNMDSLKKENKALKAKSCVLDDLESLPQTPYDALLMAKAAFGDRIIVLDEALKSAKDASKGNSRNANEVWQIMRGLYYYFYPACIEEITYSGSLEDYFAANCGYQLAMREGKMTKGNDAYNTDRTITYKKQKIVMRTHVKGRCDDPGKDLRVYLYADHKDKKIVVGYCGKHPETAGSKRRGF